MAETVEFESVSPARLLMSEPVDMVVVPGGDGDIGVLPDHAPLISTVRPGVIKVYDGDKVTDEIFVAGGFCEVSPERCTVLAEEAIMVGDIDVDAARKRLEDAEAAEKEADDVTRPRAENERRIAEAMVEAAAPT